MEKKERHSTREKSYTNVDEGYMNGREGYPKEGGGSLDVRRIKVTVKKGKIARYFGEVKTMQHERRGENKEKGKEKWPTR
ncbi:hypothetical protein SUGI_0732470 [Cryptomeria japonica]|nr:hypothetical protein SUGI_0732470 [Cryptomeria japonica]